MTNPAWWAALLKGHRKLMQWAGCRQQTGTGCQQPSRLLHSGAAAWETLWRRQELLGRHKQQMYVCTLDTSIMSSQLTQMA